MTCFKCSERRRCYATVNVVYNVKALKKSMCTVSKRELFYTHLFFPSKEKNKVSFAANELIIIMNAIYYEYNYLFTYQ